MRIVSLLLAAALAASWPVSAAAQNAAAPSDVKPWRVNRKKKKAAADMKGEKKAVPTPEAWRLQRNAPPSGKIPPMNGTAPVPTGSKAARPPEPPRRMMDDVAEIKMVGAIPTVVKKEKPAAKKPKPGAQDPAPDSAAIAH